MWAKMEHSLSLLCRSIRVTDVVLAALVEGSQ